MIQRANLFVMRNITVRQTRQLLDSLVQFIPQESYRSSQTSLKGEQRAEQGGRLQGQEVCQHHALTAFCSHFLHGAWEDTASLGSGLCG